VEVNGSVSSTTKRRAPRRPCVNFPEDFVWGIPESPAFVAADGLIYCDDAAVVLRHVPDGSVDLILTDPPYGVNYRSSIDYHTLPPDRRGGPSITRGKSIEGDTPSQAKYLFNILVFEASRLLKPGGCLCCFAAGGGPTTMFADWIQLAREVLQFKSVLVWNRGRIGLGGHYRKCYEFILVAKKQGAPCTWNGSYSTPNIFTFKRSPKLLEWHPTPKPVELMSHLISLHTDPGDLVLDPFCGQGSALTAARQLGRRFIGVDIVPQYCETAAFRLGSALAERQENSPRPLSQPKR
jgi:site-specific DNA-methyltransferase (adenine-specific)